ncbi:MAG: hypothetical protein KKG60_03155 [Nanoarchaeota archaeon]|nr:hypothetical protein [Nanoarchaeota archaeon]
MRNTIFLVGLLVILLFISGCGAQIETPSNVSNSLASPKQDEKINNQIEPSIKDMYGEPCESLEDCGEWIPISEPECLGNNLFQRFNKTRCLPKDAMHIRETNTIERDFTTICKYQAVLERIGSC